MTHQRNHRLDGQTQTYPAHVTGFIATLLPIAREVKRRWGTPVAVLIAQGALESGWGRHVVGNAYFGIKGSGPSGGTVRFATHEEVAGHLVAETDSFRAYASLAEAADDYGRFLRGNPRYAGCFAYCDQPDRFADALAAAGYATDHLYAGKLKSIIHAHDLARYDLPVAV